MKNYIETLNRINSIASTILPKETSEQLQKNVEELKETISNFSVKVPLVGTYSAGKSSLMNTFFGRDLLKEDLKPETDTSYEFYYSEEEYIELVDNNKQITRKSIDQLKDSETSNLQYIKVFVNNPELQKLTKRNIVPVDMPGINSGMSSHNQSIMRYISNTTAFIILVSVKDGTIKDSTFAFLREINEYNLESFILLSKTDQVTQEELEEVRIFIDKQRQDLKLSKYPVGITSSGNNDAKDFANCLLKIEAEDLFHKKFDTEITVLIERVIKDIEILKNTYAQDVQTLEKALEEMEQELAKLQLEFDVHQKSAQNIESDFRIEDEIINEVRVALRENKSRVVDVLSHGKIDPSLVESEIVSIVRPTLINGLKASAVKMQISTNEMTEGLNKIIDDLLINRGEMESINFDNLFKGENWIKAKKILESLEDKVADGNNEMIKRIYKAVTTIVAVSTSVLAPVIELIIVFLPDIINFFTAGKAEQKRREHAEQIYLTKVIPTICKKLRPTVADLLVNQQEEINKQAFAHLENEVQKVKLNIAEKKLSQTEDKAKVSEKIRDCEKAIEQLVQEQKILIA